VNADGKKWMAKDLYELCSICEGTGAIDPKRRDLRLSADARPLQRDPNHPDGWLICQSCGGSRFITIGLTVGQVERMRAELDAAVELAVKLRLEIQKINGEAAAEIYK
jgi:hypothetical protein